MEILLLLLGTGIGFVIAWLLLKNNNSALLAAAQQRAVMLSEDLQSQKLENDLYRNEIISLSSLLSSRDAELKNQDARLNEQKNELIQVRNQLNLEFKNLANEILDEKTKKFTEQNKSSLDQILNPLNEKLKDFEKKVEETYDKEAQQRFSLSEEIKKLAELNQQISKEANSLTKALKGDSKTQGNWGEVILENILERSGLRKGHEYSVQESHTNEDGKRFQPDVIVNYPGDRSIIIDSKVSITAYERYISANDKNEKSVELKNHFNSIKSHINELSAKKYEDLASIKTLDFVVMFMPIEPAYLLAIQNDPTLWNYAYERRILLISPTNLVAILKMIESLWKQEYQNRNVLEIARQGGNLYDSFILLCERLVKLGKKIEETSGIYNDSMKTLSEGKGNLINRVEKLKSLGLKTKKQMPDSLIANAIMNNTTDNQT